jgi:hypothetical protein
LVKSLPNKHKVLNWNNCTTITRQTNQIKSLGFDFGRFGSRGMVCIELYFLCADRILGEVIL